MNASQNNSFIKKLQEISKESYSLRSKVAEELLEYDSEDISCLFHDLCTYGCISGIICSLIYYTDTHKFYDEHYNEIEFLRREYPCYFTHAVTSDQDLKTLFCWFAFEKTADEIAIELGLEI